VSIVVAMVVTAGIGIIIERVLRPLENKDFDLMFIGTIGFGIVLEALAIMMLGSDGKRCRRRTRPHRSSSPGIRIRTYDLLVLAVAPRRRRCSLISSCSAASGVPRCSVAMDHEAATAVGINVGPQQRDRVHARRFAGRTRPGVWSGPLAVRQPVHGRIPWDQGVRGRDPRRLRQHPGAILGGLGIGLLDSYAAGHFQGYSELVTFLVFTVIIMVRPNGIFGERTVNRA
jgi:branched-chain amino acid transport system permease protein